MDIAKIKSPSAQTVAPGLAYIVMSEKLFEGADSVVHANPSASSISVDEAGYYLVIWEAMAFGTGLQTVYITGTGFSASVTDVISFVGDAAGMSHGRSIIVQATARANFGIQVINSGAGNVTYLCALSAAKLADVG
jgi:hypothetical protein